MSLTMTSSLLSSTGASVVNTVWNLSSTTLGQLNGGYKSFTLQISWDPTVATVVSSSIEAIAKQSRGDILSFDTTAISGGVLRIVGFSGDIQNFADSQTTPILKFQYTQTTYQPVNFYVTAEQINGTSYKASTSPDLYRSTLGTPLTGTQLLPKITESDPPSGGVTSALDKPITFTFNEAILPGSGNIELRLNAPSGQLVQSFPVGNSPNLVILNNKVTVKSTVPLVNSNTYFLVIPTGAILDFN